MPKHFRRRCWCLLGFVFLVELTSFTTIGAAQGKKFKIARLSHRHHGAVAMGDCDRCALVLGGLWLRREAKNFRMRWDELIEGAKRQSIESSSRQEAMA